MVRMMLIQKSPELLFVLLLLGLEIAFGFLDASTKSTETERQALLEFKQDLIDEYGLMSSWGGSRNCCDWAGVQCSKESGHVTGLNLGGKKILKGKISRSLLELKHLHYLDLSHNDFGLNPIPEFIGFLPKLTYLNLSSAGFGGPIPSQLGNLSSLHILDLSSNYLSSASLQWLSNLHFLRYLDLTYGDLSEATDWSETVSKLPSLTELDISMASLRLITDDFVLKANFSKSLAALHLFSNHLNSSIYPWVIEFKDSLVDIDLSFNLLEGPIPEPFGDFCSLKSLRLASNQISQKLSDVLMTFSGCTQEVLEVLDLSENQIVGSLPDLTRFSFLRNLYLYENILNEPFPNSFHLPSTLNVLDLTANEIKGPLPDLQEFSFLRELHLRKNQLIGTIDKVLGLLYKLVVLDLSSNYLEGKMSQVHFSNLSRLRYLDLSHNSLALNISLDWVPPFQLYFMNLCSCKLGPHFPKWLETQKNYSVLDISGAGISDAVPSKFWDLPSSLRYLNLSGNHLSGFLPMLVVQTDSSVMIDLSSNSFTGSIPQLISNMTLLKLSRNMFSGPISFLCDIFGASLFYLDLSNNLLSGGLPGCLNHFSNLLILRLDHNKLSGTINSTGSLHGIRSLHLHHNSFSGELPSALANCKDLAVLDLGENQFSGAISTWMGDNLLALTVLTLRSNQFHGIIPLQLCHLQSIRMLDLSENNFSGSIPKCICNFTKLAEKENLNSDFIELDSPLVSYNSPYRDTDFMVWKVKELEYKNIVGVPKTIDFSGNNLSGEIPSGITSLVELVSLNLSRNSLIGSIPSKIGRVKFLESLDLSRNHLVGEIPATLSEINDLGFLDLSHNNLSGRVPLSTKLQIFSASVYAGNPLLCGLPLPKKCVEEPTGSLSLPVTNSHEETSNENDVGDEAGFDSYWISGGLGFGSGFAAVCGTLILNSSWRIAWFKFLCGKISCINLMVN